ncbi:FAD-dependent oxidoreductase [Microcella pacifica]|uniref:FAD-dependent oxidoreductase n=1 Tax=Microcella pacifica TaxID=2591847 RepID=A0A9E5JKT2_9MICO|nr:FAD-dependent oxidoreductase [Microcella pacifica]NHF62333.1 FAD-dependent oxidoreductase [Microcella pacifica]
MTNGPLIDPASAAEPPPTAFHAVRLSERDVSHLPVIWAGDVVVVGGGSAGSAAAVAAARHGASTLVIENGGFFGGTAAAVLDTMYGFFAPGTDQRVVGGIGWELASALLDVGSAILRGNTYGAGLGVTYEPEALKAEWDRLLVESGAQPLLHTRFTASVLDGTRMTAVVVLTRRGPFLVRAARFVDASGDADVAWAAGCTLEQPSASARVQPLTTTFRVGGVEQPASTAELHRLLQDAAASGAYRLPRREGSSHHTVLPGVFHTNLTRVAGIDPTNPWATTAAEIEGRSQTVEYIRFLRDRMPGYENSYLLSTSVWIGTRETRRLIGRYVLDRDDVVSARRFDDEIALCAAPIEDHDGGTATIWRYVATAEGEPPSGKTYGVPYRCLVPVEVDSLLVAGRSLSATHDAHASARSIAQCLSYGQAAGTAAALSVSAGVSPSEVNADDLRQALVADAVML